MSSNQKSLDTPSSQWLFGMFSRFEPSGSSIPADHHKQSNYPIDDIDDITWKIGGNCHICDRYLEIIGPFEDTKQYVFNKPFPKCLIRHYNNIQIYCCNLECAKHYDEYMDINDVPLDSQDSLP